MRKAPLTLAVLIFTALPSLLQFAIPGLLPALMRDPDAIASGQWWRLVTSLVVQDGGVVGTLFNLAALGFVGMRAERAYGPARWAVLYVAGAAVGQTVGYLLHDPGAGNSIVVCGLVVGVVLAAMRNLHGPALLAGLLVGWTYQARKRAMTLES